MAVLTTVLRSASLYPITCLWVGGMTTAGFLVEGRITVATAIYAFTTMTLVAILVAAVREMRRYQVMFKFQRDEMLDRVRFLESVMTQNGIKIPTRPKVERQLIEERESA